SHWASRTSLTGVTLGPLWSCFPDGSWRALWPYWTGRPSFTGGALWSLWSCLPDGSWFTLRACRAVGTRVSLRSLDARLALRSCWPRITLRSGGAHFSLGTFRP